ncbi:MAG: metallophosphoesterase [Clostridia bacterium]|nr:metallophosphoesterase [Clostridia bacterium]
MKNKKKKALIILLSSVLMLIILFTGLICWGNKALSLNEITVSSPKLPKSFEGFRVAHVSDLHNDEFGKDNKKLLALLKSCDPDIIAITGDMIDSYSTDVEVSLSFAEKAVKIAPCYYVTGNHEARVEEDFLKLTDGLETVGVTVLRDTSIELERGTESITLIGVNDPTFFTDLSVSESIAMNEKLSELGADTSGFTLLLSHRPELFEVYVKNNITLTLSGHAHGGQFRLPVLGGAFAPNQGFNPKFDAGLYTEDGSNMIVSRGLGNSLFPFRVNNRPEVVLVTLQVEK